MVLQDVVESCTTLCSGLFDICFYNSQFFWGWRGGGGGIYTLQNAQNGSVHCQPILALVCVPTTEILSRVLLKWHLEKFVYTAAAKMRWVMLEILALVNSMSFFL